jgi:hypothetical protein
MAVSAHRGQDAEGGAERGDALHRPGRTQDGREIKWRASSYRPARTEGTRRGGGEEEREEVGGEEEEEEERVAVRRVG